MLQGGGREVLSNYRVPYARDDLTDNHSWTIKVRCIYNPFLRQVLDDHAHLPLHVFVRCYDFLQAHHVVSHPVATISLVGNLGLHQNH